MAQFFCVLSGAIFWSGSGLLFTSCMVEILDTVWFGPRRFQKHWRRTSSMQSRSWAMSRQCALFLWLWNSVGCAPGEWWHQTTQATILLLCFRKYQHWLLLVHPCTVFGVLMGMSRLPPMLEVWPGRSPLTWSSTTLAVLQLGSSAGLRAGQSLQPVDRLSAQQVLYLLWTK